jgi:DNA-binding MarR family transcriptional regulator
VRALRSSSRAAEQRLGVTGAQLFVLKALDEEPRLSLTALAGRTRTHPSTVSVVVKRLVLRGLVARMVSGEDGRRIDLRATARGRALLARAPLAAQDRLIEGVERLPERQRIALALGLRMLSRSMRLDDATPTMFFEDEPRRTRVRR